MLEDQQKGGLGAKAQVEDHYKLVKKHECVLWIYLGHTCLFSQIRHPLVSTSPLLL